MFHLDLVPTSRLIRAVSSTKDTRSSPSHGQDRWFEEQSGSHVVLRNEVPRATLSVLRQDQAVLK